MNNPKAVNKSIEDLISDVRTQLLNIESSMELAEIAAESTCEVSANIASYLCLIRPIISYAADQLEDVGILLHRDKQNEKSA